MRTEDARRALEAARAEATRVGKPVGIAIVDDACQLVVFERLMDALGFNGFLAESKACASAFTGRDSKDLAAITDSYPALVTTLAMKLNGRFAPVIGAVVLRDATGRIAGAIGVSGAMGTEDDQIARAGAAAFNT